MAKRPSASAKAKAAQQTPLLEWIAGGLGLLLVLLTLGFVGLEALNDDGSPPDIVIETSEVRQVTGGYLLLFRAVNKGASPAAAVQVEGVLRPSGGNEETATTTLDFVADHSSKDGGLFFRNDPRLGGLVLRPVGFASP